MHRLWTEREDEIILDRYPTEGSAGLAKSLRGRSAKAIRMRAHRLGVSADAKGHWPAGKRRNQPLPQRQINGLMRRLRKATETEDHSLRSCAAEIGVSDRTLRRWIAGEDNPSAEHLVLLQQWLDAVQAAA